MKRATVAATQARMRAKITVTIWTSDQGGEWGMSEYARTGWKDKSE